MRPRIFFLWCALMVCTGPSGSSRIAHADCDLPPLNGVSQKQENLVWVGGYRFGTAAYSYFVASYRIDALHCSKSVESGPRGWDVIVESGQVIVNREPQSSDHAGANTGKPGPAPKAGSALRNLAPLPQAARSLPALPNITSNMTPLTPLANVAPLPAVPGTFPALPDMAPLRP